MSDMQNRKSLFIFLLLVIVMILLMAFISLALVAYTGEVVITTYVVYVLIWLLILLLSLLVFQIPRILVQYGQVFFKLRPDETLQLVTRLVFGPSQSKPLAPLLQVQDGKVIVEGAGVLEKVGGPGFIQIEHNNAVVTQKLGRLFRILGPGLHTLDAFEKVWDVVDLRPQRRTITVQFMTRDGIPASAEAEVVFRIPFVEEFMRMQGYSALQGAIVTGAGSMQLQRPRVSADAILTAATGKTVRSLQVRPQVIDWITCMPDEVLSGAVRDVLECYTLDEFLYPQYWLSLKEELNREGVAEYKLVRPQPLVNHKTQIQDSVKGNAAKRGIYVQNVELGPVSPVGDYVPRAWLEFWQSKLQAVVYQHTMQVNVDPAQDNERARIGMLVELITSTVQKIQGIGG